MEGWQLHLGSVALMACVASAAACSSGSDDAEPPAAGGQDDAGTAVIPGMPGTETGKTLAGIQSCPTIDAPAYTNTSGVSSLSPVFNTACTSCHGDQGRGQGTIPQIPGALSLADYKAVVRSGRGGMPSFGASAISEAQLDADYAALRGEGASPVPWATGRKGPAEWSADDVTARIRDGLAVWRKPDKHGAACVNCHTPDAIDLAIIGYPNRDLARRALLHLSPEDTSAIIDLVHAQRRRYGLVKTCDPLAWRPMQPGGRPLEGSGVALELAYLEQLDALKLPVARRVGSYDEAVRARDAWLAVKSRTIRSTITFSRWTEDRFHGADHSSINDWISAVPRIPKPGSESQWYGLHDAYLAAPTEENLMAIMGAKDALTDESPELAGAPSALIFNGKYEAVLLAQHLFRDEVRGVKAYFERPPQPFAYGPKGTGEATGYGEVPNPFWNTGYYGGNGGGGVPDCNGNFGGEVPNCARFPKDALAEVLPGQTSASAMGDFKPAWLMLGWSYDPGMMPSMGANFNQYRGKYWELPNTAEAFFISNTRLMYQVLLGGKGMADTVLASAKDVAPIANGSFMHQAHMPTGTPGDPQDQSADALLARKIYVPIAVNTYRMWAYLLLHELESSPRVAVKEELVTQVQAWKDFDDAYDDAKDDLFPKVLGLIASATEVQP